MTSGVRAVDSAGVLDGAGAALLGHAVGVGGARDVACRAGRGPVPRVYRMACHHGWGAERDPLESPAPERSRGRLGPRRKGSRGRRVGPGGPPGGPGRDESRCDHNRGGSGGDVSGRDVGCSSRRGVSWWVAAPRGVGNVSRGTHGAAAGFRGRRCGRGLAAIRERADPGRGRSRDVLRAPPPSRVKRRRDQKNDAGA